MITIINKTHYTVPRPYIRRLVKDVLIDLNKADHDVALVLTDDATIQHYNRTYRQKDYATDVLSFSMDDGDDSIAASPELGDLIISMDRVIAQSARYKGSHMEELSRLIIHGLLHLCGYEHEDVPKPEAQKMFRLGNRLLKKYATPGRIPMNKQRQKTGAKSR